MKVSSFVVCDVLGKCLSVILLGVLVVTLMYHHMSLFDESSCSTFSEFKFHMVVGHLV